MKAKHLPLFVWALALCPLLAPAQKNANADHYQMHIKPSPVPIKLDGLLDEAAWQTDGPAHHFKFIFPNDTAYSKWRTEARLTFDDRNLYIGVVCHEHRQDYTVQSLRRDFGPGTTDVINILFDPTKDGLNGFMFGVSPYNVQRDALIANGDSPAYEWDNKWYSAVQNYDDHWTVEIAIPFKTLRYNVAKGENSWGIQFIRTKLKDFETSVWAPTPFQYRPTNLAFCGRLLWDAPPPKPGANISLIPYAIGGASLDYVRDPKTLNTTQRTLDLTGNVGGDAKIAITPGLNLDLTINPDFSQVEVDQQVANLSRFELFFPEVRQFFLENRDLFALYGFPNTRPFFSRRIGLARNPRTGFNQRIPILAGARLSGKLNDNWRIGLLNMQTQRRDWDSLSALPAANFTVATMQRKVFQRSIVSGVLVNKQNFLAPLNDTQRKGWQPYNRVAGLEYNLYSQDNRWEGEWYYHRSLSPDPKQRGATLASFLGYRDRYFNAYMGYNRVDSSYRAEAGFVPRPGVQGLFGGLGGRAYPKRGWAARHITNYALEANGDLTYGLNGQSTDRDFSANLSATFKDQTYVGVVGFQSYVYLFEPFDPTNLRLEGAALLPTGGYSNYGWRAEYYTGTSHDLQGNISLRGGGYFNGALWSAEGRISYRRQPVGLFSVLFSYNDIRMPAPYTSARFWLLGPRVELAFSRSLFISAFTQYNTQINNVNLNARLQWRFAPVSDVFLVYTDNSYAEVVPNTPVHFLAPKNKAIVLKVVYWLNV